MKTSLRLGLLLSFIVTQIAHAVTFSISPNVVSNDYSGAITFTVSGLSAGETVQLIQHYDFNGNGIVDAQDFAVREETVTDGDAKLLGTNVNINLVRDEDGATNGSIIATYRFQFAPYYARSVGKYVFECVSPSNHFSKVTSPLTVANTPYGPTVQGNVTCSGTNVPNAMVAVLRGEANGDPRFIIGVAADATGHYSLQCSNGLFTVAAFHPGYVGNLTNFPAIGVITGTNVTADVPLRGATRTISGSVVDSLNASLHPIPCAEIAFITENQDLVLAQCDTNGDFAAGVTADSWSPQLMHESVRSQGYLSADDGSVSAFDTTGGDVNNALVVAKRGTSLLYGRVVDNLGNPVANADVEADVDFGEYNGFGVSDTNGDYAIALDAGYGGAQLIYPTDTPFNNYIWPTPTFAINDGTALNLDITGHIATVRLYSHVSDNFGAPMPFVHAVASSYQDYGAYSYATADANGDIVLPLYGGQWDFQVVDQAPGVLFPDNVSLTFVDGNNYTNDIVAMRATGNIHGILKDSQGNPISGIPVMVTNSIGTTNFTGESWTDQFGYYTVDVFDGTWNVWPYLGSSSSYVPVGATNVVVPPETNEVDFVAQTVPPPTIITTSLDDAYLNQFYSAELEVTNGAYPNLWTVIGGALPDGLQLDQYGFISGTPTNQGTFDFTLQVTDARGSNDVKDLSITVRPLPTGPPTIVSTYFNDPAVGCSYSNVLSATGGTAPYTWTLADGSDPMPPGLMLDTNGVISGVPTTNDNFEIIVQCTGAEGSSVTGYVSIYVNGPLQMSYTVLSPGEVGAAYFGALYTYGGAQPQTWSIVGGSLPPGLTMDPTTGYITGTNTTLGVFPLTLRVTDGCTTIDTPASITNYPLLQITTTQLPNGRPNEDYSAQLEATGGVPPYTWYPNGYIPFGLTVNEDGSITGTTYTEGTNTLSVYLADSAGFYDQRDVILVVSSQPTPPTLDQPSHDQNGFTLRVTGTAGQDYTLESTIDLTNWSDVFTTNAPADVFMVTDTNQVNGTRFYRMRAGQ